MANGGGFFGGLAQSVQGLPQLLMQKKQMGLQEQHMQAQLAREQRMAQIEQRKQLADTLSQLHEVVNSVDESQMPIALDMFMNQIEGVTGKKLPKEFRQGIKTDPHNFSKMLTQTFTDNPEMGAQDFAANIDPQAILGMMVAFGAKKKGEEMRARMKGLASTAMQGEETLEVPTGERGTAPSSLLSTPLGQELPPEEEMALTRQITVPGAPVGPQNVQGLMAKRARLEQALAEPDLPKEMRDTLEQVLRQTNEQISSSTDDKSTGLAIAREFGLDPANPQHQALISQVQRQRGVEQVGAEEGARTTARVGASLVEPGVAQDVGISPFATVGEVRADPRASTSRIPTKADLAGAEARAREGAQTVDPSVAQRTGISPFARVEEARAQPGLRLPSIQQQALQEESGRQFGRPIDLGAARDLGVTPFQLLGEARATLGAGGARLPTEAEKAGAEEGARQRARPIDPTIARDTGMSPLQTLGEARQTFGGEGVRLATEADKAAAEEDVKRVAEGYKDAANAARAVPDRRAARQQIQALLPHISTGMGAERRAQLDRALATIGVESKGLGPTQVMDMLSKKLAVAGRKDLPGQMSDADREFLINSEVGISKDKNSIRIKLEMDEITDARIEAKAAAIPRYQRTCGTNGAKCGGKTFDEVWKEFTDTNSLQPRYDAVLQKYGYQTKDGKVVPASRAPAAPPAAGSTTAAAEPKPAPVSTVRDATEIEGKSGRISVPTAGNPFALAEQGRQAVQGGLGRIDDAIGRSQRRLKDLLGR